MSLYRYTGEPGRIWPDVPTTPEPGDVVDWRDRTPDEGSWEPVKSAATVRPNDNGDHVVPPAEDLGPQEPVDETGEPGPELVTVDPPAPAPDVSPADPAAVPPTKE